MSEERIGPQHAMLMQGSQRPPMASAALAISDVKQMASAAVQSGLFPSLKSPEAAFTLMMLCQAEGLHPIQALRRYDIIQGRPAMKADAMLGEFMQRGGQVEWHEWDDNKCSATFDAPGLKKPKTVEWTIERAKAAGLSDKGTWRQYPRNMLRARTISDGIRMAMPAIIVGLYTPEEVQDFARPAPVEVIVEPPKAEAPAKSVEPATTNGAPASPPSDPATPGMVKALNAAITTVLGIKDREQKLAWISGMAGRRVESSKELTAFECGKLIEQAKQGEMPERVPGEDDT